MIFLAALAAFALSGCVTAQEQQAKASAQVAASDDQECRSYGVQPGTAAYFQCRMTKSQQRVYIGAIEQAQANEQFNHGMCMMANSLYPGRPVVC